MKILGSKTSQTCFSDITVLLVLLLGPFFKGLYYEQQMLVFQIAVFIAFAFFLAKNRSLKLNHPMDYAAIAFAVSYLLSLTDAADLREGLLALMRVLAYLMIYLIISVRARDTVFRLKLLLTLYASGIVSAVGLLLNLTGTINTAKVWDSGIIQTTFEYKNAGALFLLICTLIGVYLVNNSGTFKQTLLLSCGNFLNILLLLGTQSRAVWLLSPLCFVLVIWGFRSNSRISAVVQTLITLFPALILSSQVFGMLNEGNPGQAIVLIALGLSITSVTIYYWYRWGTHLTKRNLLSVAGAALILVIIAGYFNLSGSTPLGEKMRNILSFDFNVQERLVFFRDALKIIGQHPLFGAGGKAWDILYLNIQSYGYYAENVHNDLLQTAVETGIAGLLALLSLWAAFFTRCIRLLRKTGDRVQKQTTYLLTGIGTAIFLHSLFDFDLAHSALTFILWTVLGMARSSVGPEYPANNPLQNAKSPLKSPLYAFILVCGILYSLVSLSFFTGDLWFSRGERILESGDISSARDYFEKARSFDPWKANTLTSLAQINLAMFQNSGDPTALNKALAYAAKSIAVRPAEPLTHSVYSTALFFKGDFSGSVREAELFTQRHPMLEAAYEQLAYTRLISGIELSKQGKLQKARPYFEKTIEVKALVNSQVESLPPYYVQLWETNASEPVLSVSPKINIYAGAANLCLGNRKLGEQLITQAVKEDPASPEVQIWNTIVLKLQGKENESQALLNQATAQDPGFVELYNNIIALANR